jgi:hypothetical protein
MFQTIEKLKIKIEIPKERCLQTKLHLSLPNDICKQQWIILGHLLLVMKVRQKNKLMVSTSLPLP